MITEAEKKRRAKVVHDLSKAAQHLRIYQQSGLATRVDEVAGQIHAGQIIDRPVQ